MFPVAGQPAAFEQGQERGGGLVPLAQLVPQRVALASHRRESD
jgi:hypothetical protein